MGARSSLVKLINLVHRTRCGVRATRISNLTTSPAFLVPSVGTFVHTFGYARRYTRRAMRPESSGLLAFCRDHIDQ